MKRDPASVLSQLSMQLLKYVHFLLRCSGLNASFIMFFDQYTADEVFKTIKSDEDKYTYVSSTGEALKISKRKSRMEEPKDYCLGLAAEILTEQSASQQSRPAIKIAWKERKVQVNDADAFAQAKTDDRGSFCCAFASILWTDRQKKKKM